MVLSVKPVSLRPLASLFHLCSLIRFQMAIIDFRLVSMRRGFFYACLSLLPLLLKLHAARLVDEFKSCRSGRVAAGNALAVAFSRRLHYTTL
jgi:hypothetical protein